MSFKNQRTYVVEFLTCVCMMYKKFECVYMSFKTKRHISTSAISRWHSSTSHDPWNSVVKLELIIGVDFEKNVTISQYCV